MPKIPVKVVTWEEIVKLSEILSEKIKGEFSPDVIIAVARGGLVPARLLADSLGVVDVLSLKVEHWVVTASHTPEARIKYPYKVDLSDKKVLIVDDITDTGDSLILTSKYVSENFSPREMKTATLQHIETSSKFKPDFYAQLVTDWAWFMYPWNYWEDEINLVKKLIDERRSVDGKVIESGFKENYGITPPIPLQRILSEMKRRKMID
ncbi:phosphoribosyltransferase [Metallosphaera sedula]|uniref:Phosphoribosyltransferase n=3 Tax=Metallosphaera TaxID=41980 RepID=A4YES3_METS5|nr:MULTISPECIES: phosphoribosyltransferase [Metallosphaera]ABP94925.1 phosphoribosyltransferase [Metallosphaera sedula DSM 5348]AIM26912.1 phosphoribosyltransferase [Metallosphaera sedula]AKV73845.1 phosphoribosyltransferase [Metallosphaera sedula]AKV76086.1 phosphoribosyltransferase [Metallosphaera sedula]AKV78337.1 phosphoribosyltransferase [Metallosphaera sedula]